MKIKLLAVLLTLIMVTVVFASCSNIGTNPSSIASSVQQFDQDGGQEKDNVATSATYISLDINPEISLIVDESYKVSSIFAENEDAQVLLYEEESIVGMELEVAVERITALAVELGYLNEENKVVGVMVSAESDNAAAEVVGKINEKVQEIASDNNIEITISEEGAYSLLCDLEAFKEKHPDNEKIQQLTPSKFKLATTAFEAGEMTVEEAVEMENEELIKRVGKAFDRAEVFATKKYDEAKKSAEMAYEKAVGFALEGVYAEFYMKNSEKYKTTLYYGMLYELYSVSERGYSQLAERLAETEEIKNSELTQEQAEEIAGALGIENILEMANDNGEITVDSIENFADKKIKNSRESEELDKIKEELKGKLHKVKGEIEEQVKDKREQLSEEKTEAFSYGESLVKALDMIKQLLDEEAKTDLETYINEYQQIISDTENIDSARAQEIAELMGQRAEEILEMIEKDLTPEDKEAIEARKAEIEAGLSEARAELESAVKEAEQQVKNHLEQVKAERRKKTH